jgi:hypothetical protein
VTQVCYRAADLAYLLDLEKRDLSHYSENLRETTRFDDDASLKFIQDNLPPQE